jgi:Ni/Co efflux regulator RcnB
MVCVRHTGTKCSLDPLQPRIIFGRGGSRCCPRLPGVPEYQTEKGNIMNKAMLAAVSAVTAISCALAAVPADAQRHDNRNNNYRNQHSGQTQRWQSWDGKRGYNGYRGKWRAGQRYSNWRNSSNYLSDYRAYNLPAPRKGYRYYRDSSGDIVMAAIATGVIASIFASQ